MQKQNKMKAFELGPLNLQEDVVETGEGMKACQDYGRVLERHWVAEGYPEKY